MTVPAKRRRVDGVLLLDKPVGMTSNAALQKVKRLFHAAKAGHTGTLDPLATGLLPLCFGEATKFSAGLLEADKSYVATVSLGRTTTTGDAEGETVLERPVPALDRQMLDRVLAAFRGTILQLPPMYSALKRAGRPLYEYARQGIVVERDARPVTIHTLELRSVAPRELEIALDCSKGTYVRTLAEDIGEALGCGAHLSALRRVRIGQVTVADAVTPAELEAMDAREREQRLAPIDLLLRELPATELDGTAAARFQQGQPVPAGVSVAFVRVYSAGSFIGLGRRLVDGRLAPERLVASQPPNGAKSGQTA